MNNKWTHMLIIACFLGALPSTAQGLDLDKEIEKQNRIYDEITNTVVLDGSSKPVVSKRSFKVSEFKVLLLPAKK